VIGYNLGLGNLLVVDDRSKFQKVLAVAVHPGTIDNEALAAFARIRELARQNPALIHPPEVPRASAAQSPVQTTLTSTITGVQPRLAFNLHLYPVENGP
jgi:hypothetical protein